MRSTLFLSALIAAAACVGCSAEVVPTGPSSTVTTATFESQLYPQGVATQTFTVASPGSVRVTLTSVRPDSSVILGLAVGIPRADGAGCTASRSVTTTSGAAPQMTITADPGSYCVRVYDAGHLTSDVFFSVSIEHP